MKNCLALILCGLCLLGGCGAGSPASQSPPPPPLLHVTPGSLSFGPTVIGVKNSPQVETLTNTGGSDLDIDGLAITGVNASDFEEPSTNCGSRLGAGATCTLNVSFIPSQPGPRTASITISDNEAGSPQVLPLNGVGVDSGPNATLSATNLNLGNQAVGTTSPAQSITLSNYGTMTLSITGITTSSDFAETNNCSPPTLAPGASCNLSLTFTPAAVGLVDGSVSVQDNAPPSPQTCSIEGVGINSSCVGESHRCTVAGSSPCCPGLKCLFIGLNISVCVRSIEE